MHGMCLFLLRLLGVVSMSIRVWVWVSVSCKYYCLSVEDMPQPGIGRLPSTVLRFGGMEIHIDVVFFSINKEVF